MTDTKRLNEIIKASGFKKKALAERVGLSPLGLANKVNGKTEFKSGEIKKLAAALGITDPQDICEIFFANN